jgi:hypothetical protein
MAILLLPGAIIAQTYDLSVTGITPPSSPAVGVAGNFVIGLSIPGGATGVTVTAVFASVVPPAVTFNAAPASSSGCTGNMAAGDPSTTVTCPATGATSITINVTPLVAGTLSVVAGVIGNQPDPNMTSNSMQTAVQVTSGTSIAGDFNGDGKPDIVWRNYATGQNALWLMNGTSYSATVDLQGLTNLNYRIEGVGDFNGDGKPDILWRNYSTGQNAVWLMNGTVFLSIVDLPGLSNVNYRFDAVSDFNGDGKPDIVLRNYATGQNAIWIMNGTALSSIVDLPGLTTLSWEIAGPR